MAGPSKFFLRNQSAVTPSRKAEKLDRVSALIRRLWPDCCYMIAIWHPQKTQGKGTFVEFLTNAEMAETAGLLRDTADHLDKTSDLENSQRTHGNA